MTLKRRLRVEPSREYAPPSQLSVRNTLHRRLRSAGLEAEDAAHWALLTDWGAVLPDGTRVPPGGLEE